MVERRNRDSCLKFAQTSGPVLPQQQAVHCFHSSHRQGAVSGMTLAESVQRVQQVVMRAADRNIG